MRLAVLNWSKLPDSLAYLVGPATKYGKLQFDDPIYNFLQNITPDEKVELQELRKRMSEDYDAIERFLNEFPITEHTEAARVYFTGHLIAIGIDIGVL